MEDSRYETEAIVSTGMSDYFLLNHEIVRRSIEKDDVITKTGRGSAPSYYTNTLLGLSSIDRFALPMEMFLDRFISADRMRSGSLSDIDMNVANREAFEQAQDEVLGLWRSASMMAFGTLKHLSTASATFSLKQPTRWEASSRPMNPMYALPKMARKSCSPTMYRSSLPL